GSTWPPIAPICASKAPTPTTTFFESPNRSAHSAERVPAALSAVHVSSNNRVVKPFSSGSNDLKKSFGGNPPNSADHKALWPAEQTPRFILLTSFPPVNKKGIQSQCSTHE